MPKCIFLCSTDRRCKLQLQVWVCTVISAVLFQVVFVRTFPLDALVVSFITGCNLITHLLFFRPTILGRSTEGWAEKYLWLCYDAAFDEAKVFPGKSRLDDGRIASVKHFVRDKISQGSEDLLKNLKHVIQDTQLRNSRAQNGLKTLIEEHLLFRRPPLQQTSDPNRRRSPSPTHNPAHALYELSSVQDAPSQPNLTPADVVIEL